MRRAQVSRKFLFELRDHRDKFERMLYTTVYSSGRVSPEQQGRSALLEHTGFRLPLKWPERIPARSEPCAQALQTLFEKISIILSGILVAPRIRTAILAPALLCRGRSGWTSK
jgi:hypothetical protein